MDTDSIIDDMSTLKLKIENEEQKQEILSVKTKINKITNFLENLTQIKENCLDIKFLQTLPKKLLSMISDKKDNIKSSLIEQDKTEDHQNISNLFDLLKGIQE